MKKFLVYLIEREDGLKYVGQTCDLNNRIRQHNKSKRFEGYVISDIKILEKDIENVSEALEKEEYWIKFYDTFNNGLNHIEGGNGNHHKEKSLKFNTLGVSYTQGTKWYHKGDIEVRSEVCPDGYKPGRSDRFKSKTGHKLSTESKKKISLAKKGKPGRRQISEEDVTTFLMLFKERPYLPNVGTFTDAAKCRILTYEKAFCNHFHKKFNMSSQTGMNILCSQGGLSWGKVYKEILGDLEIDCVDKSKRRSRYTDEDIRSLFNEYKSRPELKTAGIAFDASKSNPRTYECAFAIERCEDYGMTVNYIKNLLYKKGGKWWGHIWREVFED